MRRLTGAGAAWLRRLWRPSREAPTRPGTEAIRPVEQIVGALETLVCDGIAHRPGGARSPEHALRREEGGTPARNAFGRPVQEETGAGARGCVAVATGMTLAGLRATAFLRGDDLLAGHGALRAAADRLAPLVVHAVIDDGRHAPYHQVSGCGLFQALASSGQEALDLTLVARWVAERALVPGLVATEGTSLERVDLPDEETIRSYLGRPGDPIESPTEAQRVLFGIERPRLLRWFDPDRPVATGGSRGAAEEARARLGTRVYFRDHVGELAQKGMEELGRLTGRPLSFVHRHRLDDAAVVLVAQGASVQVACAVADHVRRTRRQKIGVLGITWLRPFPSREVAEALDGKRAVAVLEPLDGPLGADPPLFREIEGAVRSTEGWISATYAGAADAARIAGLCELLRDAEHPRRVEIDRVALPETTGFPRRDALLQSLANDYPDLRSPAPPEGEGPPADPEGGRSAGLVGMESDLPTDAPTMLAEALAAECGRFVRGRVSRPEGAVVEARIRCAPADFADPGSKAPVSLLLIASTEPRELGRPLEWVVPGGTVLMATTESEERAWETLPALWRRAVRERELRLLAVGEGWETGLEALRACARGEEASLVEDGGAREIDWRGFPESEQAEEWIPGVVRRITKTRSTHDSLPRFWGDLLQPRQAGAADAVPDPLQSSGVVPAGASALEPEPAAATLPAFDPEACTGCGLCWTVCPEAAIGVSVSGTETLLTAASRAACTEGKGADALRRAHKHLAGRLNGQIVKTASGRLTDEHTREAWTWLSKQMNLSDEERPEHEAAFDATVRAMITLEPAVTRPFFHDAEERQKGAGELLVLAVDPRACVGCGLCVAVCADDAMRPAERTPERVVAQRERWRAWEELPDTPGETIARAAEHPEVGAMAAVLLSRHCAQAQVGGAGGEAGSGERLGAKLVTSIVEQHGQRRTAGLVKTLEETREKLEQTVREQLASGLSDADLGVVAEAVGRVSPGRAALSDLGEQLRALGAPATFDRRVVLRLVHLAGAVERYRQRLAEGEDGLGRARFGVVVAGGTVGEWAGRFPHHPYYAPLTLGPTSHSVELARGIARGLVGDHLEMLRTLRRASLEVDPPPDRPERLEAIATLGWEDLDADDRAACPPLLLLGDDVALLEHGLDALTRLLASDLPVKVVLLDGRGRLGAGPEPALVAMAHRHAFVLAASIAHPDHLARGIGDALAWPGPALVHVHAPSPVRHGFPADATFERARLAVEGRAHVLFRYDPTAEGLFGVRATLEGNPAIDDDWGEVDFASWASGERRFAHHFEAAEGAGGMPLGEWLALPERQRAGKVPVVEVEGRRLAVAPPMARAAAERLGAWNVLRELTGASSPFTERIRSALQEKVEAETQAQIEALKAEQQATISEVRSGTDTEAIHRLTERLMVLAGYTSREPPKGNGA